MAQRKRYDRPRGADKLPSHRLATEEITGMLRVGRLISGNIYVTDAMVLDGMYFMSLGPAGVLRALGANDGRFPLIITGYAKTMRAGLEWRLANPNFLWSLEKMEAGVAPPPAYQTVWNEWLRYVESGLIEYRQQDDSDFPMDLLDESPPRGLDVLEGGVDVREVKVRSDAFTIIDESNLSDEDKDVMKAWWSEHYLLALAQKAGADWLSFGAGGTGVEGGEAKGHATAMVGSGLRLPLSFLTWAQRCSSASMGIAWDTTSKKRAVVREASGGRRKTERALRDLAYQSMVVVSAPSRLTVLVGSLMRVLFSFVAVVLAVPALQIFSFESILAWVLFAGVILTTVEWDAIFTLMGLFKPAPNARLVLYGRDEK